jgi:hypothetical protein
MEMALKDKERVDEASAGLFSGINSSRCNHITMARKPYFDLSKVSIDLENINFSKTQFEAWNYEELIKARFDLIRGRPISSLGFEFVNKLEADALSLIEESFNISTLHRPFEISLSFIKNVPCTKFHADFLPLRLLCTYVGPGTVFLTEKTTRYACLNQGSANNRVLVKGAEPLETRPFEILLLKGRKFGRGELKPCAHRSPEINGNDFRLLIKVDFK